MPRIDPLQLLKCLGVLLRPDGGIKSESEVQRLASLMTKFSKKLVSKCIYVQILKCSETKLLGLFMASGGWTLAHMWLTDGILSKNWALVQELLELLLLCPVHVELLKTNNCPKLVKGLSKDESHEGVRILAGKLVEQWLRIVKGENQNSSTVSPSGSSSINGDDNYLNSTSTTHETYNSLEQSTNDSSTHTEKLNSSPKQNVVACNNTPENNDSLILNNSVGFKSEVKNLPHLPVYKITLKDGKQVLAKIHPNPEKIPRIEKEKVKDSDITSEKENESQKEVSKEKEKEAGKDKPKDKAKHKSSKDKDRRHSGSSTKSSSSSSRSSSSNSKHSSSKSSSSHRSSSSKSSTSSSSSSHSHNSSRDKDKSKEKRSSSSNKSSSSSSRDKEKDKANQIEKDKATLDKLKQPTIDKLGKIPKKPRLEDGSKISSSPKSESKKPSISIEIRQNTSGEQTLRPKTVKTFNSKFRSHGLEEEAKPAPPRTLKKTTSVAPIVPPILKRTSPPRYDIIPEKKAKLAEAPVNAKPGAIKLIPAKPKRLMFVDR